MHFFEECRESVVILAVQLGCDGKVIQVFKWMLFTNG
jgi:hypothetical protein